MTHKPTKTTEMINYQTDGIVSTTILKQDSGSVTLFAFDAGQSLSEHTAPFDALVQVLDGRTDITLGGELVTVSAGEMLVMPANVPHALAAPVPFKMLLTMLKS